MSEQFGHRPVMVDEVVDLLVPAPDGFLVRRPVSTKVNDVKNEGAELLNSA